MFSMINDFWAGLLADNVAMGTSDVVGETKILLLQDLADAIKMQELRDFFADEPTARLQLLEEALMERLRLLEEASTQLSDALIKEHSRIASEHGWDNTVLLVAGGVIGRMSGIADNIRRNFAVAFHRPKKVTAYVVCVARQMFIALRSNFSASAMDRLYGDLVDALTMHFCHAENTTGMHCRENALYDARNRIRTCFCRGIDRCNDSNHVGAHVWRLDGRLGLLSTCSICNNSANTPSIGFFIAAQLPAPFDELPESSGLASAAGPTRGHRRASAAAATTVHAGFRCTHPNCTKTFPTANSLRSHKGWHTRSCRVPLS